MARRLFRSPAVPSIVVLVFGLAMLGWLPSGGNSLLTSQVASPLASPSPPTADIRLLLVLQVDPSAGVPVTPDALAATARTIRHRAEELGIVAPVVWTSGTDQIVVELPGVTAATADRITQALTAIGLLEIIDPQGVFLPPGTIVTTTLGGPRNDGTPTTGNVYTTIISSGDLKAAYATTNQAGAKVAAFELTETAASRFYNFTSTHIGQPMSIVLDKQVISSPVINSAISNQGIIEGVPADEVDILVSQLNSDALTLPVRGVMSLILNGVPATPVSTERASPIPWATASPTVAVPTPTPAPLIYTSPQFGYTVTFGEEWFITEESSDKDGDLIVLTDLRSVVVIVGNRESARDGVTATAWSPALGFELAAVFGAARVVPLLGEDGAAVRGQEPGRSFVAQTMMPAEGDDTGLVVWIECRLAPDRTVALVAMAFVTTQDYVEEMPLLQQLFAGIALPEASAATPGPAGTPQAGYTATDLGTLGGESSRSSDINDDGDVAVYSQTADWWVLHAGRWTDGRLTDLGTSADGFAVSYAINRAGQIAGEAESANGAPQAVLWTDGTARTIELAGFTTSWAGDVNDAGHLVGGATTWDGGTRAYLWVDGVATDLGTLGYPESAANAINSTDQIVGIVSTEDGNERAFMWSDGLMTDLGTLGGDESAAVAINDAGQIAGWATDAAGNHRAVRWVDGRITDLGTLGGNESEAVAINARGQVIGWAETAAGDRHAFRWTDGVMEDLGTLGGKDSEAKAINDAGQVAGGAETAGGAWHAVIWQDGQIIDLGALGGAWSGADAINARGQIAGWAETPAGAIHAVVWTPPATDGA